VRRAALAAGLLAAALGAAPASAKLTASTLHLLRAPVAAPSAVKRTCSEKALRPGTPGAVVRTLTVPMGGMLDARLNGSPRGGDWDLAVFNALTGRMLNGSAAFGANEVVQAAVTAGDVLTIQACRRTADAAPVTLSVRDIVVAGTAPAAVKQSLVTIRYRSHAQLDRLGASGIDFSENGRNGKIDAVLHGAGDAAKIRAAGLSYSVKVPDLIAYDRAHVRTSFDPLGDLLPSGLPSGRRLYRHLVDYQNDLKAIVDAHPAFARAVILPGKSVEGRTLEGIEMAYDVARTDDGRPTHIEVGLHHVREWPSGEVTMEYGFTLAKGAGHDARVDKLLTGERTFVIPVINPDGLEATQMAGDSLPVYDDNGYTSLPLAAVGLGPYRRKNCEPTQAGTEMLPCVFKDGIDINRNYGAFWGGPGSGASPGPTGQTYRGPSPFSEPETQAFHKFSSAHQVMVINSNHTYAGDFLFQPGFGRDAEPGIPYKAIDKPIGQQVPHQPQMKALSDAMGAAAGYKSFVSYDLYDVTGATEDWNYFAQSAFGYTAEVAWQDFHPDYQDGVIDQYLGTLDGPMDSAGTGAPATSKGLQESFLLAGEAALDPANHSVIEGDAPAGSTLKLTKDFFTATSYSSGTTFAKIPEHLETTLTVPASGHYVWHVDPSSRPVALIAHQTEAWTLSCGNETRQVVVEMGQRVTQDLTC
jgi:hypothetical protein